MFAIAVAFVLAALGPAVSARILNSTDELKTYDFVIVGSGPGGSAVANRLSETNASVLVLEAGGANDDDITIDVPLLCTRLTPDTPYDWNYTTTPQAGLNGRTVPFPRGIGLGGSSAVNCLVYTRGSQADIDKWAELSGDENWGWEGILPYFMKSEKFNFPVDGRNVTDQFNASVHGFDGFIGVSVPGAPRAIDDKVMETTKEFSEEFPFTLDVNTGDQLGVGWVQALVDRGVRSSSKAYLTPEVLARPNLDILLHAHVARVSALPDNSSSFNVVQFLDTTNGQMVNITATKEVILSAGAVSTPAILMHSGIGNATFLFALGITPLVDLPSVGQNLTDHIGVSSTWRVNSTKTWDTVLRNATLASELMEEWETSKTGILVDTSENHLAFLRLPEDSDVLSQFGDPASGPRTAHFEFLFQNGLASETPDGNFINIPSGNVSPKSSGSISINSTDPFSAPLINPNLLTSPVDIAIVRHAVRSAQRFVEAPVWSEYILERAAPPADINEETDDDALDEWIRNNAVSFFHPVATAAMSPKEASWGVVDPELKVKGGVLGLRIIDASVAPSLPAAHTSAHVYAIAERAADIIKANWGLA